MVDGQSFPLGTPEEAEVLADRYTKVILTIIAINLSVIVAKSFTDPNDAMAQTGPVPVVLKSVDAFAFSFATVPVRVTNP